LTKFVNESNRQGLSFQSFPLVLDLPSTRQGTALLRIHRTENEDVVFTLSGRIDKENIADLQALVDAEGKDRRIILDLKDMTLTGQDGIDFLAQCEAARIALVNCDPYVREWITGQNNGS
jgi:anti-anti-sigma regulatory factor